MASKAIQDYTNLGAISVGDKLLGERVDGTTVRITYTPRTITGTADKVTVTDGDGVSGNPTVTIASTYAGQASIITLGTVTTGTWQGTPVAMSYGGLNANLTASNGGVFYSTATAGAVLSGTATANKMLLSGSSAAPTWSTSTIPSSAGATGKLLLSDGTNYVLSTPTFPNASATSGKTMRSDGTNWVASTSTTSDAPGTIGHVLVSDGTNWITSTPTLPITSAPTVGTVMQSDGTNWTSAAPTGTGVPVLATSPTLVTPALGTPTSGNLSACTALPISTGVSGLGTGVATFLATPSSANLLSAVTNETGTGVLVFGTSPTLTTPNIVGTVTNDNASAGSVGEVTTSAVAAAAITTNTFTNVTSISLGAGDWDVWGSMTTVPAAGTLTTNVAVGVSTTTATMPSTTYSFCIPNAGAGAIAGLAAPNIRLSLSGTTTVYLVGIVVYSVSTLTVNGVLTARRRR